MPTGSDAEAAEAYYDYLAAQALALQAEGANRTVIDWAGPLAIVFFSAVLIGFFMLYSLYFQQRTRRHDELYGITSFAGVILERSAGIPLLERVVWTVISIFALYVIVTDVLFGQFY